MASITRLSPRQNIGSDLGQAIGQGIAGGANFGLQKQFENVQQEQQASKEISSLQAALQNVNMSDPKAAANAILTAPNVGNELKKLALTDLYSNLERTEKMANEEKNRNLIAKISNAEQENQSSSKTSGSRNEKQLPNDKSIIAQTSNEPENQQQPPSRRQPTVTQAMIAEAHLNKNPQLARDLTSLKAQQEKQIQEDEKLELNRQKLALKQEEAEEKKREKSYGENKDFIDSVTQQAVGWETEMKPRLMQMQHLDPNKIINPTAAVFLESLGIPLGALEDPSSELYNKLSQDLLKGLPETYGNRILKVEVDNFLKTIPTLLNSVEGRRMIASNMLKLGEMKEVYYKEMRKQQKDLLDNNKRFPKDFQQRVFDSVAPQISKINKEFVKMSEVTAVPEGTIPFFNPQGEIMFVPNQPEWINWASGEGGGKRIW